ncbi:MAG: hypothetical protein AB1505_07910 [Candidatus Latescibacterota bacterium]
MRKVLLQLHLHGALLCASYLLIFAVSALNYNHGFGRPAEEKVTWGRVPAVADTGDNAGIAEAVRDTLGLLGWTIPWETRRDEEGDLHFGLVRPGKHYAIHVLFSEERISVDEVRQGFWPVVNQLHALTELPGSPFVSLWGIYTEVCFWVVLFAAASGVYLWLASRRDRRLAAAVLAGASGLSLLLLVLVWWRG